MRRSFIYAGLALVAAGVVAVMTYSVPSSRRSFPAKAESRLKGFGAGGTVDNESYADLFTYLVQGFETYRSPGGASAAYPGLPSQHGRSVDGMEGFSRVAPLLGAWVRSGRPSRVTIADGRTVDLYAGFRRGLILGTDSRSAEYWGDIRDFDQRIVEASDVALALWLFREPAWRDLTPTEKQNVVGWLRQVEGKKVHDNNWHLFPVLVDAVLHSLNVTTNRSGARRHYERVKEFYRGDGWFSDGPGKVFDYYNAWGIHYALFWLQQIEPQWDSQFIGSAQEQFLSTYKYLLGSNGFPILGRSVCYRMAAPAPLVFAQAWRSREVSAGEARRALDGVWVYFVQRGALRAGSVTQGYCGPDPRILDNYSGPASCLWALRSLVVAFYQPPGSALWSAKPQPLPVEKAGYSVRIQPAHWTIVGNRNTGAIRIEKPGAGAAPRPLEDYGLLRGLASTILRRPFRPPNLAAKYVSPVYDSAEPFCGCLP